MKTLGIDYSRSTGKPHFKAALALLKVVADSPDKLRLCDIERLFETCENTGLAYVVAMHEMLSHWRKDAAAEFGRVANENGHVLPTE